jgi:hypothetical protein
MITVKVRWLVALAPELPDAMPPPPALPPIMSAATPADEDEETLSVAILSYTLTSRRCSSVVTTLGAPSTAATRALAMPTRISR